MGRSVSTPSNARHVFYLAWMDDHEDEDGNEIAWDDADYWQHEWDYVIYDLREHVLLDLFPSVLPLDRWHGREDRIIAANGLAEFGISEYMGIAAVWVIPYWLAPEGLANAWIDKVWPKVKDRFPSRLARMGTFSNGESVYRRIEKGSE